MKLPPDALIAPEKLVNYLLVKQARGDKSVFLASAGEQRPNFIQLFQTLFFEVGSHLARDLASQVEMTCDLNFTPTWR
jgi:hypothetical protein